MQNSIDAGASRAHYKRFCTVGANIGRPASDAPTGGVEGHHVFNPVMTNRLRSHATPSGAPFTTVMNWHAHDVVTFRGRSYGQKATEAIEQVNAYYARHSKAARRIACNYLDTSIVLKGMLNGLGI